MWFLHPGHDHARGAETTLQGMAVAECLLHGMQVIDATQTFDGQNLAVVGLHCEHCAGLHRRTVQMDGTCAALRGITPDVGTG